MSGYNGWKNRETWLVALWFGEELQSMRDDGIEVTAETVEQYVHDTLDIQVNGFVWDILGSSLSRIDYKELAEVVNDVY